jgi:hypothetical protein
LLGFNNIGDTQRAFLRLDVMQEKSDQKAAKGRHENHGVPRQDARSARHLFAHRAEPGPLNGTNHFTKGYGGQRGSDANQASQQPNQRLFLAQRIADVWARPNEDAGEDRAEQVGHNHVNAASGSLCS